VIDYHECLTNYHRFLCFSIGQIDGLLFKKIHRSFINVSPIPILTVIVKDDQTNNFQQTKSFNLEFLTDHKKEMLEMELLLEPHLDFYWHWFMAISQE
jgi:hypothetical protein